MRNRQKISWILINIFAVAFLLNSCEDVINVNLKNVAPRLVIEGSISNLSDSVRVYLHKTTDYYKPLEIASVNDADVVLTDPYGNRHTLPNIADGVYAYNGLSAQPGDSFNLDVTVEGVDYSGSTKMPGLVKIDSLVIDKNPDRPEEDRLNILIHDPPDEENYYRVEVFRNDTLLNHGNDFILYNDKYFNGREYYLPVSGRRLDVVEFTPGDRIKVRLMNIEKSMYDYLGILRSITDENQFFSASAPTNPPNNLSNDALGYFASWAVSEKTIIKNQLTGY